METKLIIIDTIILNACPDTGSYAEIEGACMGPPFAPLLANFGQAKEIAYATDILVSCVSNH